MPHLIVAHVGRLRRSIAVFCVAWRRSIAADFRTRDCAAH